MPADLDLAECAGCTCVGDAAEMSCCACGCGDMFHEECSDICGECKMPICKARKEQVQDEIYCPDCAVATRERLADEQMLEVA